MSAILMTGIRQVQKWTTNNKVANHSGKVCSLRINIKLHINWNSKKKDISYVKSLFCYL